ncbi:Citrate lyase subunit beta [Caloramator mitchellensis]|uniref:Citrate lyase subunit beta n=1 Tax=Caloramator mitchellensis TaxID=908809 RepID=A0A0R3JRP6_CALMK|nr:CoA ester lyase [Caloramator mitchellensis]KRQ86121.1 Citrate lyase subunit beta [Caloramator mitchellensis]
MRRSMLFIPGNNPSMVQNSPILGADSIILDLEDAVSIDEKDAARHLVRNALLSLDFGDAEKVVRINSIATELGYDDIDCIARVKPDAILVPKASEDAIEEIDELLSTIEREEGFKLGSIKIIPLIETAFGLEDVFNIVKSSKRVKAVLLGAEDLTADMEIKRTKEGEEIFYARSRIVSVCKALKVDAIDTPFTDVNDFDGLLKDCEKAKLIGMTGKAAINPRQVDIINEVFSPSLDDLKWATRVIEAYEEAQREGKGVFSLDGKMVDAPILARAKNVIEKAKAVGLI